VAANGSVKIKDGGRLRDPFVEDHEWKKRQQHGAPEETFLVKTRSGEMTAHLTLVEEREIFI